MTTRVYAFGYYGGKLSHLDHLLPRLPMTHTYVEPFGGSGAVLLNRAPSPVEVYNDLDGEIVTFFRVLREQGDELEHQLVLTPYSRVEFERACTYEVGLSDMERARRLFIRVAQSRLQQPDPSSGQWSNCITISRLKMAANVSRWQGHILGLQEVVNRLQTVQLECLPALEVIKRYDTPETLFYVDPPYLPDTGADASPYAFSLTNDEHRCLLALLTSLTGRVALSGYKSSIYAEMLAGWHSTTWQARTDQTTTGSRTEVLWTNYDPAAVHELPLFAYEGIAP